MKTRILGYDPGLATIGYGILDVEDKKITVVDYGVISTPKDETVPVRLALIYKSSTELIMKFKPDEVAMEQLFFNTNLTTGINVAQARGVLIVSAIHACGLIYEYTPLPVKMAMKG